jgi:mannose-6-phosphate isomerase-like protein (cupin superfamily)
MTVGLIRQSDARPDQPVPGLSRLTYADRDLGAGALTTRIVMIEPGTRMTPHWHRVEEAMMVLEGAGQAILGDEIFDIKAGETLLGPAGIPHGFFNTGSVPMKLAVAFPAVDVETYST